MKGGSRIEIDRELHHYGELHRCPDKFSDIGDIPLNCCRGHHRRTHQQRSTCWTALSALEISIAGRCADLATFQLIRVHRQTH